MRHYLTIALLLFISSAVKAQLILLEQPPAQYVCYRATGELTIDGNLNEPDWNAVDWTEAFVDIEGDKQPLPYHETRVKMLWDDQYLYIAAKLEEPHLWATLTERESIIFYDNDFEIFIDPDGDTHNYCELEVNALGTEWDLLLTKPYRFGGKPISSWNIAGLKCGIHLQGTLNDPSDVDTCWTVELALPWNSLQETYTKYLTPDAGDQWRINFSRVHWRLDVVDGRYTKIINPETGRSFPEHNWVWSPQHIVNMHKPEYWGYVQFSGMAAGDGKENFAKDPDFETKVMLRWLFDEQYKFMSKHNRFALSAAELGIDEQLIADRDIIFDAANKRFTLSCAAKEKGIFWFIGEDSKLWKAADDMPREILPW
jgi:hypothetical protein